MRRTTLALAMLLVFAFIPMGAASAEDGERRSTEPAWFVDEAKLPFDAIPGFEDSQQLWGVSRGAGYRIEVPANWNGTLVMWAHGYRGEGLELTVDNHPLREFLIPSGYAWAASSYSANGYNAGVGVRNTNELVHLFEDIVGSPSTTYITGASMGGHVTARAIEQPGHLYDGAMPICGVVGDYELFDYFLDFNAAAQQIGLGASAYPVASDAAYIGVEVPAIKASLEAAPGAWPFVLNADGEAFKQLVELQSGGDRPNFDEAFAFWNSIPSTTGVGNFLFELGVGNGMVFGAPGIVPDNTGTEYQLDLDPALSAAEIELNEQIVRVAGSERLRVNPALLPIPNITGDIDVPVLTLHNLGDLFVPFHNEIVYAQDVANQGNSDLLVQRAIRGVSHCGFTPTELVTAFVELDAWVQYGIKPAGDIVLDPAVVASEDYGCTFTDFDTPDGHVLPTPCPVP